MKLYYATRAITETLGWVGFLLLIALLHDEATEWLVVGLVVMSTWYGVNSARDLEKLKRECERKEVA